MKPALTIISGGPGGLALLTAEAESAIREAARLYAPHRMADTLRPLNSGVQAASIAEIREGLTALTDDAAVVVTGDSGFFSVAQLLTRQFEAAYRIRVVGGLSSLQLLCGRLGLPWNGVHCVSLHGRDAPFLGAVSYHRHVFLLTGGDNTPQSILAELCRQGLGHLKVAVGENLSLETESIRQATAAQLAGEQFSPLAVLLVENNAPASPFRRLRDSDFVRGEVPMTKETIRALAVNCLEVAPTDTVWDIGAGTGSVSVALAYAAHHGAVHAIERQPEALTLLEQNRAKLGAYNLNIVTGEAPEAFAGLPAPQKVFLGGSGGRLEEIVAALTATQAPFTLCVTAIALENAGLAVALLKRHGFADIEIHCVNAAQGRPAGNVHLMMAQNPVYILCGRWQP